MPEVDPQVIGWHVGLVVGVDGDGVDVVGVGVGEHSARAHLHHEVHRLQHRHLVQECFNIRGGQETNIGFILNDLYSIVN